MGLLTVRNHVLATPAAESLPEPAAKPSVTRKAEIQLVLQKDELCGGALDKSPKQGGGSDETEGQA